MALPGQWQVGQLYLGEYRNGLKVWSQPAGQGGLVYPQLPTKFPTVYQGYFQTPMAYPSLYISPCGHPLNCWEIYSAYDPYEEEVMALICCPMCSFIAQVMPLAQYENYEDVPIVVA